ncbi:hypothetical protein QBC47DRAFT_58315 [Echria macrotheca]|uniref:Secreted protein n=1 Tax=Echria macrotheca TaxID=438768 RepID=A0AAJ0B813_9PEZI|nr:hypothetical protein QBC47DRAFT_58315 [Echria macrotheca]
MGHILVFLRQVRQLLDFCLTVSSCSGIRCEHLHVPGVFSQASGRSQATPRSPSERSTALPIVQPTTTFLLIPSVQITAVPVWLEPRFLLAWHLAPGSRKDVLPHRSQVYARCRQLSVFEASRATIVL